MSACSCVITCQKEVYNKVAVMENVSQTLEQPITRRRRLAGGFSVCA